MTHAYDKVCLERAADTLGRMLDYSVYSLRCEISEVIDLFVASGIAALFGRGDIRTIAGMSGIELAYEVLEKSGIVFERTQPRYTKSLSPEYWYGHALAHIQWETCLPFDQIARSFSPSAFTAGYASRRFSFLDGLPLDIGEAERSAKIKEFGRQYASDAVSLFLSKTASGQSAHSAAQSPARSATRSADKGRNLTRTSAEDTALKKMRIKNGLSQSALAEASGIPVRTIQQYEQRQKDLSKARAEYLIALARVLNCDPSHLLF